MYFLRYSFFPILLIISVLFFNFRMYIKDFYFPNPNIMFYFLVLFFYIGIGFRFKLRKISYSAWPIVLLLCYTISSLVISPSLREGVAAALSISLLLFIILIFYNDQSESTHMRTLRWLRSSLIIIGTLYILFNIFLYKGMLDYKGQFVGLSGNRYNTSLFISLSLMAILSKLLDILINRTASFKITEFSFLILFLILGLLLIYLTYSRIGIFVVGFYVVFLIYVYSSNKSILFFLTYIFSISVLFYLSLDVIYDFIPYVKYAIERGGSGRGEITSKYLALILENKEFLFTGFGVGSLDSIGIEATMPNTPRDSHNLYAIVFEYGIIGCLIFVYLGVTFIRKLRFLARNEIDFKYISILSMAGPILFLPSSSSMLNFNNIESILMYVLIGVTLFFKLREDKPVCVG